MHGKILRLIEILHINIHIFKTSNIFQFFYSLEMDLIGRLTIQKDIIIIGEKTMTYRSNCPEMAAGLDDYGVAATGERSSGGGERQKEFKDLG